MKASEFGCYVMMRGDKRICRSIVLVALGLTFLWSAGAREVSFSSASPYQLADLLSKTSPTYDVAIGADLIYPEDTREAMPAFVFMHGSSGRLLRHHRYLELARGLGYVTLQVDSFTSRGVGSTVGDQTHVTAAMMTTDVLRALKFVAGQPNIDPNKIVIMGSSKGAVAALYATWDTVREKVVGELDYAGYILLYPFCTKIDDGMVTASNVHIFMGDKDNWTPAAPCVEQVDKMKSLGRNWEITLYQGAYHGFDAPIESTRLLPNAYSMVDCRIVLRSDGYEVESGSGYLLTRAGRRKALGSCAKKGSVRIGGYHAVSALLHDIEAFLRPLVD